MRVVGQRQPVARLGQIDSQDFSYGHRRAVSHHHDTVGCNTASSISSTLGCTDSARDADTLLVLVEGEMDVTAMVGSEPVPLHLAAPGDLIRIISFVGDHTLNVSVSIKVVKDSTVLQLRRSKPESLLQSHPSIAYCVMCNLVRYVHGVARRKNAERKERSNFFYRLHGCY